MLPILGSLLEALLGKDGPVGKLLSLIPDPNARREAEEAFRTQAAEIAAAQSQAQTEVDKTEAASASVFVAGWRPFVGWICGCALAWQFILLPILSYAVSIVATARHISIPPLPSLDTSSLYTVLMGMLGLGGLRTWEKVSGVARNSLDEAEPPKKP